MITSVGQRYKSIESQYNYKIDIGITYRERDIFIDIRKAKDNFDKNGRPKCFNCNMYGYVVKKCQRPKKNKKVLQVWQNRISCKELQIRVEDEENNNKQKGFIRGLE